MYWPALRHKWAAPPYSVVCYLYGAGGEFSRSLQHPRYLDFVTRSGCVLIVPRYQSGYGRLQPSTWQVAAEGGLQAALRDHNYFRVDAAVMVDRMLTVAKADVEARWTAAWNSAPQPGPPFGSACLMGVVACRRCARRSK